MLDEAINFLEMVCPEGVWPITAIHPDPIGDEFPILTRSFTPEKRDMCRKFLGINNGHRNLYWQVNSVIKRVSKKTTREDIKSLDYLHVDVDPRLCDPDDDIGEHNEAEKKRILAKFNENLPNGVPRPTIIIDSGGGYQAFWKLREPIPVNGDLEIADNLKLYNKQLEIIFGADNCHNLDRVMRLPGTENIPDKKKLAKGRKQVTAKVVSFDTELTYSIEEFSKAPPSNIHNNTTSSSNKVDVDMSDLLHLSTIDDLDKWNVPKRIKNIIETGQNPDEEKSSRSEWLMAGVFGLVVCNVPDRLVVGIILDGKWKISESVLEKKNPNKYSIRQLERAKKAVGENEKMNTEDELEILLENIPKKLTGSQNKKYLEKMYIPLSLLDEDIVDGYLEEMKGKGLKIGKIAVRNKIKAIRKKRQVKEAHESGNLKSILLTNRDPNLTVAEKQNMNCEVTIKWFVDKGAKFIVGNNTAMIMVDKKLLVIESEQFHAYFYTVSGVVKGMGDFVPITNALKNYALMFGDKCDVHQFVFFDNKKMKLYISNFDDQIIAINGQTTEIMDNGDEGVLFVSQQGYQPIKFKGGTTGHLDKYFFSGLKWDEPKSKDSAEVFLTEDENYLLLKILYFATFFRQYFKSVPLVLLKGVKGSGKTFWAEMVGLVLFGKNFKMNIAPKDYDDLLTIASNTHLMTMDNLDGFQNWICDALCVLSTGVEKSARKKYSDNTLVRYAVNCWTFITSRTPKFRRDDVADRLIIFKMARRGRDTSPQKILNQIENDRELILGETFSELRKIIAYLKDTEHEEVFTDFRHRDFYEFGVKVSRMMGCENVFRSAIEKMRGLQNSFCIETNPLAEFLREVALNSIDITTTEAAWLSAKDLFKQSQEPNNIYGRQLKYTSAQGLAQAISHIRENISHEIKISNKEIQKITHYKFEIVKG